MALAAALNLLLQVSLRRNTTLVFSAAAFRAPCGVKPICLGSRLEGHDPCGCISSRSLI